MAMLLFKGDTGENIRRFGAFDNEWSKKLSEEEPGWESTRSPDSTDNSLSTMDGGLEVPCAYLSLNQIEEQASEFNFFLEYEHGEVRSGAMRAMQLGVPLPPGLHVDDSTTCLCPPPSTSSPPIQGKGSPAGPPGCWIEARPVLPEVQQKGCLHEASDDLDDVEIIVGPSEYSAMPARLSDLSVPGSQSSLKSGPRCVVLSEVMALMDMRTTQAPCSFGSLVHYKFWPKKICRPCMFERLPGRCRRGISCDFCHLHPSRQQRRKEKVVAALQPEQAYNQIDLNIPEGSAALVAPGRTRSALSREDSLPSSTAISYKSFSSSLSSISDQGTVHLSF
jgi:hypothetical protein